MSAEGYDPEADTEVYEKVAYRRHCCLLRYIRLSVLFLGLRRFVLWPLSVLYETCMSVFVICVCFTFYVVLLRPQAEGCWPPDGASM